MQNAHQIRLEIPSEAEYVGVARHAVECIAHKMCLDPNAVQDVTLAVGEACTNAMRHGTASRRRPHVTIVCTMSPEQLQIDISNRLAGGEPCPCIVNNPDCSKEGGYGLYIMKKVMDEVSLIWGDRTATVRMIKRVKPL